MIEVSTSVRQEFPMTTCSISQKETLAASQSGCTVAYRDVGGGSRPLHQKRKFDFVASSDGFLSN